ncbi:type II restriction endonuclease, partial [Kurthia sp. 3B1D]
MTKDYYQTFNFKVIYIFSIPHASHKGRLKIGDTVFEGNPYDKEAMKAAVKQRIDQYTKTADIEYNLLHFDLAVTNKGKAFRDYDVHSVLKRSGIKQTSTTKGREWFEIDLDTAIAAIEAVKKGESSLGQIKATTHMEQIIFRPEQEKAIVETLASIDKGKTKKLWNAKMRFGKTVSALELVKRAGFKKTIIITHRPVVSAGWFEDFHKIFNNDYRFGSNHKGESFTNLINGANPFVYFASMQDLRGSVKVGGDHEKNDLIFETKWDCVIVDEAHEGNKTPLAKAVHKNLERSFTLELSGTPFNLFEDYEDEADIYTWDYVMEQQAKYEWDQNNFGDSNPYASLPKLSIFTYHLDKEFINHQYVDIEDKAFNFREFFRTYDNNEPNFSLRGKFVHEKDVWDFLNLISKKDRYEEHQTNFPFSTDYYRDNLRNTLWLVPGVQEARALSELMKEHDVFSQFDIINVAGSGDNDSENIEALEKVKKAIGDDPENAYTITITCG